MKTILPLLLLLANVAVAQIPNADFENWANMGGAITTQMVGINLTLAPTLQALKLLMALVLNAWLLNK